MTTFLLLNLFMALAVLSLLIGLAARDERKHKQATTPKRPLKERNSLLRDI